MPRGPATCVSVTGEARPHLSLLADAITAGEAQERNGEPSLFFLHARHACGPGAQPRAFSEIVVVGHAPCGALQKGGVPAAPSGTATLLRLSPNHRFHPRPLLEGHGLQAPPAFMA